MTLAAALGGALQLHPGRALPTIDGSRGELVPRLTLGRPAQDLPRMLGTLFTLCSSMHRLAARRAVAAAQGQADAATPVDLVHLQLTQAREQILRITMDWPRQLPGLQAAGTGADAALLLRSCPLWRGDLDAPSQLQALPQWLEHKWLGMAPQRWLAGHREGPHRWAASWCESAPGPVAATLRTQCAAAMRLSTACDTVDLLADAQQSMPELARRMNGESAFCEQPHWRGSVPDTGPWSRTHDNARVPADSAWARLVSRVADTLQLAGPRGAHWLAHGALSLGPGEGIAWVEMARGLLVHTVRLEGRGDQARVAACHVLAPTEWNFHPHGLLAQALVGLSGPGAADEARCLAVAFDPCVEFEIHAAANAQEPHRA